LDESIRNQLSDVLAKSLGRQEALVADLTQVVGQKWDNLLTASYAGFGLDSDVKAS
jgi:hypothetical protein